jgi:hypothetical protein
MNESGQLSVVSCQLFVSGKRVAKDDLEQLTTDN